VNLWLGKENRSYCCYNDNRGIDRHLKTGKTDAQDGRIRQEEAMKRLMGTATDVALTILRVVLEWCSSRMARKKCWMVWRLWFSRHHGSLYAYGMPAAPRISDYLHGILLAGWG